MYSSLYKITGFSFYLPLRMGQNFSAIYFLFQKYKTSLSFGLKGFAKYMGSRTITLCM